MDRRHFLTSGVAGLTAAALGRAWPWFRRDPGPVWAVVDRDPGALVFLGADLRRLGSLRVAGIRGAVAGGDRRVWVWTHTRVFEVVGSVPTLRALDGPARDWRTLVPRAGGALWAIDGEGGLWCRDRHGWTTVWKDAALAGGFATGGPSTVLLGEDGGVGVLDGPSRAPWVRSVVRTPGRPVAGVEQGGVVSLLVGDAEGARLVSLDRGGRIRATLRCRGKPVGLAPGGPGTLLVVTGDPAEVRVVVPAVPEPQGSPPIRLGLPDARALARGDHSLVVVGSGGVVACRWHHLPQGLRPWTSQGGFGDTVAVCAVDAIESGGTRTDVAARGGVRPAAVLPAYSEAEASEGRLPVSAVRIRSSCVEKAQVELAMSGRP